MNTYNALTDKPDDLNQVQWQAVRHTGGHLLIIAGPGTGKTHTLTRRAHYLARELPEHQHVLAITFTNKAAEEMRSRLELPLFGDMKNITVGTFHQVCLQWLREYADRTELPDNVRVADEEDRERLAKIFWPDKPAKERRRLLDQLSCWKSEYTGGAYPPEVIRCQQLMSQQGVMDFDDILCETVRLLTRHPDLRATLNERYPYILVDEYQDINGVQQALLQCLVSGHVAITAIGDPNQAIYGFRGSDVKYFHAFKYQFRDARILYLNENYRSHDHILKASAQVMAKDEKARPPQLMAHLYGKGKLVIHESPTDKSEAEYVVHQIETMVGGTSMFSHDTGRVSSEVEMTEARSFGDIAVLYRMNAQRHALVQALQRSGIPYQISGDTTPSIPGDLRQFLRRKTEEDVSLDVVNILKLYAEDKPGIERELPWDRLLRLAQSAGDVRGFLDKVSIQKPEDAYDDRAENVSLMTLHASKGLEFPVVFITGCEEGLLPLSVGNMTTSPEEERRLFYVGMTRAKDCLILTHALKRRLFGETVKVRPSPFLADIQDDLKIFEEMQRKARRVQKPSGEEQLQLF